MLIARLAGGSPVQWYSETRDRGSRHAHPQPRRGGTTQPWSLSSAQNPAFRPCSRLRRARNASWSPRPGSVGSSGARLAQARMSRTAYPYCREDARRSTSSARARCSSVAAAGYHSASASAAGGADRSLAHPSRRYASAPAGSRLRGWVSPPGKRAPDCGQGASACATAPSSASTSSNPDRARR